MKIKGFLTKSESGLLILTLVFLVLMVCIFREIQTEEIAGDYVITTQKAAQEPVTPMPEPLVNVNTADLETLDKLSGIGPALAERIIAYREEHGPFQTVEDLLEVKGIGEATLEEFRQEITLGEETEP